ncbi:60S ribosomal protein L20 [Irineochytrium annulatum]|nr:60S ribosomal protein L20 [Irineochytrium annulatum]
MSRLNEYQRLDETLTILQVIGRRQPTERDPVPKLFRMRLFAPNEVRDLALVDYCRAAKGCLTLGCAIHQVVAKSRYFYFLKKVNKVKKASGEIVSVSRIFEKKPLSVKNFGIWLRYDSRSGTHNMYKEYRELTRTEAVAACYQDMASRHRARFSSIHIIKVDEVTNDAVRRPYIKQILEPNLRFPLPHRLSRPSSKRFAKTFIASRPSTF